MFTPSDSLSGRAQATWWDYQAFTLRSWADPVGALRSLRSCNRGLTGGLRIGLWVIMRSHQVCWQSSRLSCWPYFPLSFKVWVRSLGSGLSWFPPWCRIPGQKIINTACRFPYPAHPAISTSISYSQCPSLSPLLAPSPPPYLRLRSSALQFLSFHSPQKWTPRWSLFIWLKWSFLLFRTFGQWRCSKAGWKYPSLKGLWAKSKECMPWWFVFGQSSYRWSLRLFISCRPCPRTLKF